MESRIHEILKASFRPEFLNRVDETIIFKPLGRDEIREIVVIQVVHLRKRLQEKKIELELSDKAEGALADKGYDPVYGARPLKRTIQKYIQDPLATEILKGDFKEGDTIKVDVDQDNEFTFKAKSRGKKATG